MRRSLGSSLVGMGLAFCCGASACGGGAVDHPDAAAALERLRDEPPEEEVATVGARTLGVEAARTYWSEHPDSKRGEVIDRIVDREVAVQRAVESGLHREMPLQRHRKRAMVRALLRREVEDAITASDLEDSAVEKIEESLRRRLGRPAGIRASHLLVMPKVPNEERGDSTQRPLGSDEQRELARTWAERIRGRLPDSPSVADLYEVRRSLRERLPDDLQIVIDAHLRFPAPGAREFRGKLPEGWMRVVDAFATAAAEMLESELGGHLSKPTESKYGWHLVRPESRLPAKVPDPEATREVAVSRRLRERRRERFDELWSRWEARTSIAMNPERLSAGER